MEAHHHDLIAQFSSVTGANPSTAQAALSNTDWNLEEAVTLFYAASEEAPQNGADAEFDDGLQPNEPSVPQTTPSHPSSSSAQPGSSRSDVTQPARRLQGQRPKQMTLEDLKKMQQSEDDEDDDDEDKKQDMFAGGEKSGLAVRNPDSAPKPTDHFGNIMKRARQNPERPPAEGEEAEPSPRTHFTGRAQTLGGDDAPSEVVGDPLSTRSDVRRGTLPRVNRTLHLWADGVSIDDGALWRFDDPANQDMMAQINQGRAPLSLLNVAPDQEVDLNLVPHREENYKPSPKKYKPFEGQGQRLGSPTPGIGSSSAADTSAPAPSFASTSTTQPQQPAQMTVDDSRPALQLQIRLGDGTRLSSRFNTSHTIGDVYEFVNRAESAEGREWVLMTTFPSKELTDKAQVLGEMSDFKRGGVVVQKWK